VNVLAFALPEANKIRDEGAIWIADDVGTDGAGDGIPEPAPPQALKAKVHTNSTRARRISESIS